MFLQLLVAQMRYQDPLNPADSEPVPGPVGAVHLPGEDAGPSPTRPVALVALQMAFGASAWSARRSPTTPGRHHEDRGHQLGALRRHRPGPRRQRRGSPSPTSWPRDGTTDLSRLGDARGDHVTGSV